ncbi:MAG: MarR family transcriptional regulator [Halovenus sp.]
MAATLLNLPAPVRDHPSPSARLAWLALSKADRPLAIDTLVTETGVSADRIRRVLDTLREADLVERRDHPADARRNVYAARDSAPEEPVDTPGARIPDGGRKLPLEARSTTIPGANPRGDRR